MIAAHPLRGLNLDRPGTGEPAFRSRTSPAGIRQIRRLQAELAVEVRLSNIHGRGVFRHDSRIPQICLGAIGRFGEARHRLGFDANHRALRERIETHA